MPLIAMPLILIIFSLLLFPTVSFSETGTVIIGDTSISDYSFNWKMDYERFTYPYDPVISSAAMQSTIRRDFSARLDRIDLDNYICVSESDTWQRDYGVKVDYSFPYDPLNPFVFSSFDVQNNSLDVFSTFYCSDKRFSDTKYFYLYLGTDFLHEEPILQNPPVSCASTPSACLAEMTYSVTVDSRTSYKSSISLGKITPRQSVWFDFTNVVVTSTYKDFFIPSFIQFTARYKNKDGNLVTQVLLPQSIQTDTFQHDIVHNTSFWSGSFYVTHTFESSEGDFTLVPFMTGSAESMFYAKMPITKITFTALKPHVPWIYRWDFEALNAIKKLFSERFTKFFSLVKSHFVVDLTSVEWGGDPEILFGLSRYRPLDGFSSDYIYPEMYDDNYIFRLDNSTFQRIYPALSVLVHLIACYGATRIVLKVKS